MRRVWAIAWVAFVLAFGCETADRSGLTFGSDGAGLAGNAGADSRGGASGSAGTAGNATATTASGATAGFGVGGAGASSSGGSTALAVGGTGAASAASGGTEAGGSANLGTGGGPETTGMECDVDKKPCGEMCVAISDPTYGCDPTLCDASGCPDAPGATLACVGGQCVIGECGAGTKNCGGRCVSISDPAYGCGDTTCDAASCPNAGVGGSLACDDGACVIDTCPANYKKCDDKCVSVSDPTYGCGDTTCDDTPCPAAGNGTLVCQGGACVVGTCGSGTKKCGDRCVTTDANNGCADTARCAACASNESCQGSPTACQCVPIPQAMACAGKCGSVPNGCGGNHTCGGCTAPQTCGGGGTDNLCGCTPIPMGTACSGKNCGSVSNGCGGTYTCGSCTSPQTCNGGGTPNVCGCTPIPMGTACSNRNCGSVANGCGGNYSCGTCGGTTPSCVSGTCRQCGSVSDCPAGTFNCSNNACVCRVPTSANGLKDGGFDSASVLNSWSPVNSSWTNSDADGCPQSGSVLLNGSVTKCFTNAVGGAEYALGFMYKQPEESSAGCYGAFYQDRNCTVSTGTPEFINTGLGNPSSTWAPTYSTGTAPENTLSIKVVCSGTSGMLIDQIYLRTPVATGAGF